MNCRGEYMPVVRIRKSELRNKRLVPGYETIGDVLIHQRSATSKTCRRDVLAISQNISHPFCVDVVCPAGLKEVYESKPYEQVSKRSWVQYAGIEEDTGHSFSSPCRVLGSRP